MPIDKRYLGGSILLALVLCAVHITGNKVAILAVMLMFMAFLAIACLNNYTLPLLLFFLPWSSILRLDVTSYSFFTFGIVMISFLSMVKKNFSFKNMYLAFGMAILAVTLTAKLLRGHFFEMDYIAFIMLIFVFPVIKEEYKGKKYDFFTLAIFLSIGAIIAALCAKQLMYSPNIRRFITVHSYLNITRMTGFYEDPNFYVAQITAAMGGCFYLLLREKKKTRTMLLAALNITLLYCGVLSGSKSFVVVVVKTLSEGIIFYLGAWCCCCCCLDTDMGVQHGYGSKFWASDLSFLEIKDPWIG